MTMALLIVSVMPAVLAVNTGIDIGVDIITEDFEPEVWLCDRNVADDLVEPQLYDAPRFNNYAFEGESITWDVLVMDKNGKEKIMDVFATIGSTQGAGNDIEVNCVRQTSPEISNPYQQCEAKILEEKLTSFDDKIMAVYTCTLTVETSDSMEGEYWVTVEAEDMDGLSGTMAQNEYWFLNPTIALSIDGDLVFDEVRPGARAYSETLLIGNDAEDGSGVLLDMYISGTDFYDSSSSGAMCPTTNQLALDAFTYDAVNGQTFADDMKIRHGDRLDQAGRIMDYALFNDNPSAIGNVFNFLAPGAEMAITFQLDLPEPCNGDFDTGSIYFWGEAI